MFNFISIHKICLYCSPRGAFQSLVLYWRKFNENKIHRCNYSRWWNNHEISTHEHILKFEYLTHLSGIANALRVRERARAHYKINNYYYLFTINELSHIKKLTSFKLIPTARTIFQVIVIIHFFLYVNTPILKRAREKTRILPLCLSLVCYRPRLGTHSCMLYKNKRLAEPWLNFTIREKKD